MRIDKQMIEGIRLHTSLNKADARKKAADILAQVGIPDPERVLKNYPHQLSGGMSQRVMIAMAMSCEPDLLIADEPTTALDVTIQAEILELMRKIQQEKGMSILLITHDLGVVAETVSYTHLDVYKRQDDYRATSGITDGQKDTDDLVYTDEYGEWNYISYRTVLQEVGLPLLVVVVTVILGLAALLLPLIPSLEIGKGIFSRIPLEINFFLALSPIWTYLAMLDILSDFLFSGNSSNMLGNISHQISWLIQFGIWSLLYSFWFVAVLSFRSLVTLGPKRYFLERIWTVRFFRW